MNLQQAYDTLELPIGSSSEEAKKKYREFTKKYHPDVNKEPNAEDKFKKINEAYQIISSGKGTDREEIEWNHGSPFNPFGRQNNIHVEISNINLYTTISFQESILGSKKDLKFTRKGKCTDCNGQGEKVLNNGCERCGGKGQIIQQKNHMIFVRTCDKCFGKSKTEKCKICQGNGSLVTDVSISVNIPGGVINDNILRLGGMGNFAGSFMTMDQYTDAHLHISVIPEDNFLLEGQDVVSVLKISLLEALRGCNKSVKTVMGNKDIIIKPTSRNKEEVIIPHMGVNRMGNQRIVLDVQYPNDINKLIDLLDKEI